jgi:hypothetical protein
LAVEKKHGHTRELVRNGIREGRATHRSHVLSIDRRCRDACT